MTRTPDAHWMTEAHYRGQKVVVVSPDYADNTKFADEWLALHPSTDAALAMAMGHVILTEFFGERQVPYFTDYVRRFTDLPFLVTLTERDGACVPSKFLTAADLDETDMAEPAWKTVLVDDRTGEPVVPNGSVGFHWNEHDQGRWNLDLGDVVPRLSLLADPGHQSVEVLLPRFDADGVLRRGVPAVEVGGRLVTTVFDLLMAQYGVRRDDLPGRWPSSYDDPAEPCTPAWQQEITSVPAERVTHDPAVIRAAEAAGVPHDWLTAARRSPVYRLIHDYRLALPLHPEYRTMPMVWYIPPLSPVVDAVSGSDHDGERRDNLFGAIDALRIPVEYLAELFTAGDTAPVRRSLRRLAAMRSYMRAVNLGQETDEDIPASVGLTGEQIFAMHRLLALAKYDERYVIPTAGVGQAHDLEGIATQCSLDVDGGPGMGGGESTVDLVSWDDGARPDALFPTLRGQSR